MARNAEECQIMTRNREECRKVSKERESRRDLCGRYQKKEYQA